MLINGEYMPRPKKCRNIRCHQSSYFFKPRGIPIHQLEIITLDKDEVESLRLADIENLHHEKAAEKMGISRATFGRILSSARSKVANGIINGKAIEIEESISNHIKISVEGELK